MASPQAEDGHTDIANELLEAFARLQLSGHQWRLLCVVLRLTFGWHRKMDEISLSTFEKRTGIPQKKLIPALKNLVSRNIILKDSAGYITSYGLQKDWESWKNPSPNGESPKRESLKGEINPSPKREGNPSPNGETSKKGKKGKKYSFVEGSDELRLASFLLQKIRERKPDYRQPDLQKWAKEIDLMIRIDHRAPERIDKVILWCQQDPFWQNNILSTEKLRIKFDQLELKMNPSEEKKDVHSTASKYAGIGKEIRVN